MLHRGLSLPNLPMSEATHRVDGLPRGFLVLVASMVAITPFAIDTYLPAMPTMAADFAVDIVQVNYTLSLYLIGFAVGQLIGGPVSDQIGRKKIGLFGLLVFIGATLAIIFSATVGQVQGLRFVQAFGGGLCGVVCMPMVRDAYEPRIAVRKFPIVMMVMLLAPLVAPLLGSLMLPLGWEFIFAFLGVYGLLVLLAFSRIPETSPAAGGRIRLDRILPQYIAVITRRIDGRPVPLMYIVGNGFVISMMLVFINNASFMYLEYFQVGEALFPFYFGANVASMLFFTLLASRLIRSVAPFTLFRVGRAIQFVCFAMLAVMVLMFDNIPVLLFTPLLALSLGINGLVGPAVSGLYLTQFKRLVGSASSLMGITMFFLGGVLGAVSGLFHDGTLRPMIYTMLAAIVIGNLILLGIPKPEGFVGEEDTGDY